MKIPLIFAISLNVTLAHAQSGDASAGETLYMDACAQCHGSTGRGNMGLPSLAGNDADYIASRLKQYRAGVKAGGSSSMMISNAADLSDADIANLAAFISTRFR
jgi:cytochrome c553